jgi:hypothetical protein
VQLYSDDDFAYQERTRPGRALEPTLMQMAHTVNVGADK